MLSGEDVGTEIPTSDSAIGGGFDTSPPFSIEPSLSLEPVRDELLAGVTASLSHLGGELRLATGYLNSAPERGNVVTLHARERSTRKLVDVNNFPCFTANKEPCTVLVMSQTKRKPAAARQDTARTRKRADPDVGPDGLTLAQRVRTLMVERGVGQAELARMCSEYYATFAPAEQDKVQQQHIFNILQGQSSAWSVVLIAAVFDVSELWLQYGIGPRERRLKN